MDRENWQRVKEVFYSALKRPESDRDAYLSEACSGDAAFRSEVELLLNSYESDYLEQPVWPHKDTRENLAPSFLSAGAEFSHYKIIDLIGRGGMGEVYLANDTTLDRRVAIKIVHEGSGLGEIAAKRLLREARSAARLDHPNICAVYEVGETNGRPYIAMQYIEGQTLESHIRSTAPTPEVSIGFAIQIADALHEAHKSGIVHRDIKPSNIIIDLRGQVKVLDFSLAKQVLIHAGGHTMSMLTEIGTVAGTVAYMSPEQARGLEIDSRSDIWSLAVVLFEMLTLRHPFFGSTKSDIIASILQKPVPSLENFFEEYPHTTDKIITKALQKDIEVRYDSAAEFAEDLRGLSLEGVPWIRRDAKVSDRSSSIVSEWSYLPSTGEVGFDTSQFLTKRTGGTGILPSTTVVLNFLSATRTIALLWFIAILSVGTFAWLYYSTRSRDIAFIREMHQKMTVSPLFAPDKRPEGTVANPSFSPDGKFVAYDLLNDGSSIIYVKNVDAGDSVKISDGRSFDRTPVWSPDGLRLTFLSNRDGKEGLWTISYLGGDAVFHSAIEGGGEQHSLRKWSLDLEHIYSEVRGQIKRIDLNNGNVSDVPFQFLEGAKQIAISPDEKKAAFVTSNGPIDQVWVTELNGSEPTLISNAATRSFGPSWFPDSEEIAYCVDISGKLQVVAYNLGLGMENQLTFNEFNSRTPIISPDGSRLRYLAQDRFEND